MKAINDFLLGLFTGHNELRPALMSPNLKDGSACASDEHVLVCYKVSASGAKVYWKDSVKSFLGRNIVSAATVGKDYNMFK